MYSFLDSPLIENISIGIGGAMIIKALAIAYEQSKNFVLSAQSFSVSGIWTAAFESHIPGKHVIEIFKITHKGEKISLYLQQYNNMDKTVRKYRGAGIFRGKSISLVYFDENRNRSHNGVFFFLIGQDAAGETIVKGRFVELGFGGNSNDIVEEEYVAKKIYPPMPILCQLNLGINCFAGFQEANDFFVSKA